MTKEEFIAAHGGAVPRISEARSFLRQKILEAVPQGGQSGIDDSLLCGYGSGSQAERDSLNAEFEAAFGAELAKARDELAFPKETLRALRMELPCGSLERLAPDFDGFEPGLARKIMERSLCINDIALLSDDSVGPVLEKADRDDLCFALRIADEAATEKILSSMPEREASMLKEDMRFMRMILKSEAEGAAGRIMAAVSELDAQGAIRFEGRAEE